MAWQRRMAGLPGPLGASGEAGNGEPVTVEMLINGVWTDITSYVMVRDDQGQISITRGIRDEGNQTEQATGSLPLKNQDGRFTPRNPMGIWYGLIGRNQPIRVSVPDGMGGKSYRLPGEVPKFPQSWDPTGTDVWVDVSAVGILQRLSQGPAPERSVIYNAVTDPPPSGLVAYWPLEDASGATSLTSALTSGSAMTWTGTPTLASYDQFPASDPVPDLQSTILSGGVARYGDPTAIQVRFLCHIPTSGLTNGTVICSIDQLDDGGPQLFDLYYGNFGGTGHGVTFHAMLSDGTDVGVDLENAYDIRGKRVYISIEMQESGTSVTRAVRIYDLDSGISYDATDTVVSAHLNRVTRVRFGPASISAASPHGTTGLSSCAIGHVTVENTITSNTILGVHLNPIGETAGRRIQRLCGEEGIPFEWIGDLDDTVPMGAQGKQNLYSLIQEAVLADDGLLYESPGQLGLGYRTRASLYNQDPALVLSYTAYNLSEVPTPTEDDRYLANRVTVSVDGVTATYEQTTGTLSTAAPPAGVGVYGPNSDSPLSLNLATSDTPTLLDQAAWRVHLGTTDEPRYPQISVNLAHASITPDMRRAILSLRLGDRVQVQNPPSWLGTDTIDQLVLGMDESITHFEHRLTFQCKPASPYSLVGYLDSTSARIDTDGSALLSAVGSSDTSIDVVPTSDMSMLWTTDTAEVPWDIRVGGEVMRVTAVSPKVKDTFTRTVSNGWGTADTGQGWSTSGGAASDYSTNGTQGLHSVGVVNSSRYTIVSVSETADVDVRAEVATSALATGGPQYAHVVARYLDANNLYSARLAFNTDQSVTMVIQKRVAGTQTDITSVTATFTHAASTFYVIRFQLQGATLLAKAWPLTDVEPPWLLSITDSSLTGAGSVGVRSTLDGLNTNVLPVTFTYDNFQVLNPQTMTVTRSINGVVKAQTAGTDVRLANPTYLAL